MTFQTPPETWGGDEVTKFLDVLRRNQHATFFSFPPQFHLLVQIDGVFRTISENLDHSKEWFAGLFLLRAHSNFLSAIHLLTAGQLTEAYAVLRLCIENTLYGLYFYKNPESCETWLQRQDSNEHKQRVRREFHIRRMLKLLYSINEKEWHAASTLYELTIDFGAHPNEFSLTQSLKITRESDQITLSVVSAGGSDSQFELALRTAAQVGVCALSVYRIIFQERFDCSGVAAILDELRAKI